MKSKKQTSKPKSNILSWIAICIAAISLFISGTQHFRTQRAKIAIHPDTRLLSKTKINSTTEQYSFGFVFQNKGVIECSEIDLNVILIMQGRKIITKSKHSSNAIFPDAVFNTIFNFKLTRSEVSDSSGAVHGNPEDLLLFLSVEYSAFPFGKHYQHFYYVFNQENQKMYHCDIPNVNKIDEILAED